MLVCSLLEVEDVAGGLGNGRIEIWLLCDKTR